MALKGKMKIEGMTDMFTVVECEYYFNQKVNPNNGLVESGLEAGQIIVTIVTPAKGKPLYEWMLDEFHYLNGVILLVTNVNSHRPANRHIWFENAKCIHLYEYFNSHNSVMMTTRLTIQPAKMGFIDGNKFDSASVGYDFRHKRRTVEMPGEIDNSIKMDWESDRNRDYVNQILNDPNY